jgi:DNA excision repair protein ERCC-2
VNVLSAAGGWIREHVQQSRPASYEPEVTVSHTARIRDYTIQISGRIDGIFHEPNKDVLEEIKSTTRDLADLKTQQNELHWAQLKIYAYIHAADLDLEKIETCLTYVQLETNAILAIRRGFDFRELKLFFEELVERFAGQADERKDWQETRNPSIRDLAFPFPEYRKGQREMAIQVFRAVRGKHQLLVQAPTGIGKTMATVFSAIKAMGDQTADRIFYLAARTTGKKVAEGAVAALQRQGLRLRCLVLTAKEKVCFNPGAACNGEECEFARGYYDRINAALTYALKSDMLNRHFVESMAWQHRVCPFELSLDLSLSADMIICDYNYAFDPQAYLRRFFQIVEEEYVFLVDEAHNLVDRARDMFSAQISRQQIEDGRKELAGSLPQLSGLLENLAAWMDAKRAVHTGEDFFSSAELPEDLLPLLQQVVRESDAWLSGNVSAPFRETVLDLYFMVSRFVKVSELFNEQYAVCYNALGTIEAPGRDFMVNLFCIDPSSHLQEKLENIRSAIFFSATLTPMDYFREIFGCDASSRELILSSPFPRRNFSLTIDSRISTLFREREETREKVAEAIEAFVGPKIGNYLIFFPSYAYLMKVYTVFCQNNPDMVVVLQNPGMGERERQIFIEQFSRENTATKVGFAVLGGVFGEGIDLKGDRLAGAVVVSVGMPPPTPERELIREYFEERRSAGWEFAYVFPGFNRVLQASGRVIRTETDRGAVLLIDKRYGYARYRSMFPAEWQPSYIKGIRDLETFLKAFWKTVGGGQIIAS